MVRFIKTTIARERFFKKKTDGKNAHNSKANKKKHVNRKQYAHKRLYNKQWKR